MVSLIKKIILLISLILLNGLLLTYKIKGVFLSKIDLNLAPDEIGIIISDASDFLLVKRNDENTLIAYNDVDKNNLNNFYNLFDIKKLHHLILSNNQDITSDNKYNLQKTNLSYLKTSVKQNIISINFYNYKFCIYQEGTNKDLNNCTFIYFDTINDDVYINDTNKVVFYSQKISDEFKEKLYTKWIDSYTIDDNSYTILKIKKDNYNIINISK